MSIAYKVVSWASFNQNCLMEPLCISDKPLRRVYTLDLQGEQNDLKLLKVSSVVVGDYQSITPTNADCTTFNVGKASDTVTILIDHDGNTWIPEHELYRFDE